VEGFRVSTPIIRQADFHTMVTELTQAHHHSEPYAVRRGTETWYRRHHAQVPSLLNQLASPAAPSTGEGGAGDYASRPAAHLEALDTLAHIDLAAARWVRDLGEDDPANTAACVRKLHGLHASATEPAQAAIERDVRRWWTQARIVTGWDSPAWRPDSTCYVCGHRGGLRIRLAAVAALCIECRAVWDETNIGILADHIRAENHEDDAPDAANGA